MFAYLNIFIAACLFTLLIAPIMIGYLKKFRMEQHIRKNGAFHERKQGTPTVGALIFLIPILTLTFYVVDINENISFILLLTVGFAFIGFIDDLIKIKRKRNLGLTVSEKLVLQIIVTSIIYTLSHDILITSIFIPNTSYSLNLESFYFLFFLGFTITTVNATNITDGLDGLLAGIVLTILVPFAVISYTLDFYQVFIFILICMGAILGFLLFNINPANVFMGDTGSHSLGGVLAGLAFITKTEILFILMGGVVFIEALTVIIQVASMKLRKKRVFLMTPIHHTFELMGWHETKIVKVFWLINFSLSFISILLFR